MKLKTVLIGPPNSGKSCIFNRLKYGDFYENVQPSTQPAYFKKEYEDKNIGTFFIEYWDTAGQERYRAISPLFFQDAQLSIVVFDINDENSYTQAKDWVLQIKEQIEDSSIFLVGNKIDLLDETCLRFNDIAEYSRSIGAMFFQTSAKTGEGLQLMFNTLVDFLLSHYLDNGIQQENQVINVPDSKKKCC